MPVITRAPTANAAAGGVYNGAFTNPQNAYTNDGVYATAAPGKNQEFAHHYTGFDFSVIPDNATINSVTIRAEHKVSTTGSIAEFRLRALLGATLFEPNIADTLEPTADTVRTAVLTTIPTVAQLKDPGFTLRPQYLRGNTNTAFTGSLDYIEVTVDYTETVTQNLQRTAGDTVAVTDTVARVLTMPRTTLDTTTLSESVNRAAVSFVRTTSDTITSITDSIARGVSFIRTSVDNAVIGADSVAGIVATILYRTASDTITTVTDTVARVLSSVRSAADTTSLTETVSRVITFPRSVSDTITTVSDSVARLISFIRSVSDTTSLSESVSRAGLTLARTASDATASVSDAVTRVADKVRTASDTTGLSDVVTRVWNGTRSAADTLPAITDAVSTSTAIILYRTAVDTLSTATDAISRTLNMTRSALDTLTTSDTITRIMTFARTSTDNLGAVTDTVVRGGIVVRRTVTDSLNVVSDVVTFIKGIPAYVGGKITVGGTRAWWRVKRDNRVIHIGRSNRVNVRED